MAAIAFGKWHSPLRADLLTQKSITIAGINVDPITHAIYHVEARPYEGGRNVPVRTIDKTDVTPEGWNARTRVQEYGGVATAVRDGQLYFSDVKSNRIHRVSNSSQEPTAVSPDNENHRFGDFVIHPVHSHLIVSILEDHTGAKAPKDVVTSLVCVNTKTSSVKTIIHGADFYQSPRISPDGLRLAYVQWSHPNMPWEASQLYIAKLDVSDDGVTTTGAPTHVAGQGEVSVSEPDWASDSSLVFLNDVSGFINPWVYDVASSKARAILPSPVPHDFGEPAWLLGASRFTSLDRSTILASPNRGGGTVFTLINIATGSSTDIPSPYVDVSHLHAISSTEAVFVGGQLDKPAAVVFVTLPAADASPASSGIKAVFKTLHETSDLSGVIPQSFLSACQSLSLSNPGPDEPLHVLYTPPRNPNYSPDGAGNGEKPPCVINVHGGPTHRITPVLSWEANYYTSRGWAWVDVNYGGSSGYGRTYRDRLRGTWGVVDVEDCITSVKLLGERGLIDPKRAVIRGGSAGGFTVLAALVAQPEAFAAGTSRYGVSDLRLLALDTHKFESRYLEKLIGGTIDEVPEVYHGRSPVHHAEKIGAPLLILQGSDDAVVPPNQAEAIVKKIQDRGGRVKYVVYEGEGHGWRKSENILNAILEEAAWYNEVLGLKEES